MQNEKSQIMIIFYQKGKIYSRFIEFISKNSKLFQSGFVNYFNHVLSTKAFTAGIASYYNDKNFRRKYYTFRTNV